MVTVKLLMHNVKQGENDHSSDIVGRMITVN